MRCIHSTHILKQSKAIFLLQNCQVGGSIYFSCRHSHNSSCVLFPFRSLSSLAVCVWVGGKGRGLVLSGSKQATPGFHSISSASPCNPGFFTTPVPDCLAKLSKITSGSHVPVSHSLQWFCSCSLVTVAASFCSRLYFLWLRLPVFSIGGVYTLMPRQPYTLQCSSLLCAQTVYLSWSSLVTLQFLV